MMRFLFTFVLTLFLFGVFSAPSVSKAVNPTADSSRFDGFVIALAWPKALAKETNDWYDNLMRGIGFNDGGYYRVGHAALVLVNAKDSSCHFFDFGRYHTPVGMGRVRDEQSDVDLTMTTRAQISGKRIQNFDEILCELSSNPATHASGTMYASYVRIHFQKAYHAAKSFQETGYVPYGPFEENGTNCSRFVRTIILAGDPNWAHALRLEVVPMITPTTLYPVASLYHWTKVPGCLDELTERRVIELKELPDTLFRGTLPAPEPPANLPRDCQWLAGESAGSWFHISLNGNEFLITRYAPTGIQECSGYFLLPSDSDFDYTLPFTIDYPSHCSIITLRQEERSIALRLKQ